VRQAALRATETNAEQTASVAADNQWAKVIATAVGLQTVLLAPPKPQKKDTSS
jgi:hypothetical protein